MPKGLQTNVMRDVLTCGNGRKQALILRRVHQNALEAAVGEGEKVQRVDGRLAYAFVLMSSQIHQQVDTPCDDHLGIQHKNVSLVMHVFKTLHVASIILL